MKPAFELLKLLAILTGFFLAWIGGGLIGLILFRLIGHLLGAPLS